MLGRMVQVVHLDCRQGHLVGQAKVVLGLVEVQGQE